MALKLLFFLRSECVREKLWLLEVVNPIFEANSLPKDLKQDIIASFRHEESARFFREALAQLGTERLMSIRRLPPTER